MKLKKIHLISSLFCLTSSLSHGVVSLTAALVGADAPIDALGLVVVDTDGNGFGNALEGSYSISTQINDTTFIDGNDDRVVGISSFQPGAFGSADSLIFNIPQLSTTGDVPAGPFTLGTEFAIYWFPTISNPDGDDATSVTLIGGESYGFSRFVSTDNNPEATSQNGLDFILISGIDNFDVTVSGSEAQTAFTVQAIPEPTSTALLGLGGLALLARRRRA